MRSFSSGLLVEKTSFLSVRSFYRGILLRKTGILNRKLFTYHAEENWGALHHKFLPITCGRRLSFLHPKLHTDMQTEIHAHVHNILRLIICMRKYVWLSSLSISHSDFISDDNIFQASCIAEPKFCIWPIPLTKNIRWSCTWLTLLRSWLLLLWWFCTDVDLSYQYCGEECTLMQNWLSASRSDISHFTPVGWEFHFV